MAYVLKDRSLAFPVMPHLMHSVNALWAFQHQGSGIRDLFLEFYGSHLVLCSHLCEGLSGGCLGLC